MRFGVQIWGVDVGISVYQADEVVGDAVFDEVVAGMDVAGLPWHSHCKSKVECWEVVNIDGCWAGLGESDGFEVVTEAE